MVDNREPREAADQTFRKSIAQVIGVRVRRDVGEGQHSKRIDGGT